MNLTLLFGAFIVAVLVIAICLLVNAPIWLTMLLAVCAAVALVSHIYTPQRRTQ